jgi:hypothetical protein
MLSSATPRRFSVSLRNRLISLPEQLGLDLPEVAPEEFPATAGTAPSTRGAP